MNPNTTIPVIETRDSDSYVYITWVMANGHSRQIGIPVTGGNQEPRDILAEMVQHTYLMGVDAGEGIVTGIEVDRLNADLVERNQREKSRIDGYDGLIRERNERIEQLEAALASALRVCDDKDVELRLIRDERDTMHDERNQFARDAADAREQRDAVADGVDSFAPTEMAMVSLYETGFSNGGQDDMVGRPLEAGPRQTMYDIGRSARIQGNEVGVRIEALMTQVRETNENWQRRYNGVIAEFDAIAVALLERAIEKSLCPDYEQFVGEVNARTRTLKLHGRVKTYTVSFSVEAEPSGIERELRNLDHSYNVECDQLAQYTISFSVECNPDDIDSEVEQMRSSLYECDGVTDVTHNDTEEDDS